MKSQNQSIREKTALFLVWPQSERDKAILSPVIEALRTKTNYRVFLKSIFNSFYYYLTLSPDVVVVANFSGSSMNHIFCKFAYLRGTKVVSLISEGVIADGYEKELFWGVNKDKTLYVDRYLLWNNDLRKKFSDFCPQYADRFAVTGATAFDRFFKKEPIANRFLANRKEKYKGIISYAGWAFDLFESGPYFDSHRDEFIEHYGIGQLERFRTDRLMVFDILKKLVKENSEFFFIFKYHPGTINTENTEITSYFKDCENVLVIGPENSQKITIYDLINASDLWLAYESTTAVEAWMMNKQTIFINPSGDDFNRSPIYKGVSIAKSYEEMKSLFTEYFSNKTILDFESKKCERESILQGLVGYVDGKSGERAADDIAKLIETKTDRKKANFFPVWFITRSILKYLLSFVTKKYSYMRVGLNK